MAERGAYPARCGHRYLTDAARVQRYAHDLGVSFPVYLALEGAISDRYWSWGVPVTYLIDPGRAARCAFVGAKAQGFGIDGEP